MKMEIFLALIVVFGFLVASCRDAPEPQTIETEQETASLTIAAVGDSLTAGYGVAESEAYPALVETALRAEGMQVQVVNAGVSGETTSGTLARLDWVLTLAPDIVILETGANDGLRGLDPAMVRDNLRQIVDILQGKDIVVVLAGMKMVWNLGPAYTGEFNRIYPDLAAEKELIFMPFFLQGVATDPALNLDDGIHPNPAGYRIIAGNILPFVREAIAVAGSNATR
ncbi:arylesterase [Desulfoprunum benzoelyticum]|uniref:Acyl-CoA thioesterase-1 n=1 Tax=Desulfoprunum benzoelyticum TaxID=1506996 RepID=A0A840UWL6_9BACT|nr:arylesterase [Desulfoprunum benzoelyticum]MBB5347088.1 acyl-CoA thioesterase-1 [Desulfoprunum benzoelyticum]MBM9529782.1 arylesterase [Desulfoprunum benzoelyticum]